MTTNHIVVIDTQVFLRALINPKSLCGRMVFETDYDLFTADPINQEILEVLNRPRIRRKFPQITEERVSSIRLLLEQANWVELTGEEIVPICRDPKDDKFLACARAANADFLVSEDNDLLVIKTYEGTSIVNVAEFLARSKRSTDRPPGPAPSGCGRESSPG